MTTEPTYDQIDQATHLCFADILRLFDNADGRGVTTTTLLQELPEYDRLFARACLYLLDSAGILSHVEKGGGWTWYKGELPVSALAVAEVEKKKKTQLTPRQKTIFEALARHPSGVLVATLIDDLNGEEWLFSLLATLKKFEREGLARHDGTGKKTKWYPTKDL